MHIGKKYSLFEILMWTRKEVFVFIIIASIPTAAFELLGYKWLAIPWLPIALIGTAVAFLIGFKNNASYDRMWEGRKIWGGIVNASRTWGIMARDFVNNDHAKVALTEGELRKIHSRLYLRHFAWLTALRYQLRKPKEWENMDKFHTEGYKRFYTIHEREESLDQVVAEYLTHDETQYILSKKNRASHILSLQSMDLKELKRKGLIEDFRHMELENMLKEFYTLQGKSERIKNFPYPSQFATFNQYFVWLFIVLVPFGMLKEFQELGGLYVWLNIPFTVLIAWVFHTMEKIGGATENPFEGGANDVPITSMSRSIEIDMRQMLDETDLPEEIEVRHNIST